MDEQEYINVQELTSIRSAKEILKDIVPANSKIISCDEFISVVQVLSKWESKLYKLIKIE